MIGGLRWYGVGEKMFRRLVAVVLVGEAFVFFFVALVAWAVRRDTPGEPAVAYLVIGCVLAVVAFLTSGLLRRPWGVTVGWVLQFFVLAASFVELTMLVIGAIFLALWITALVQGDKMDALTAQFHDTNGSTA
ncbi:DUF4233 domain-containing protein [Demetria terragena]|uniref:DUF4233 domain-containing protein n=1 Tax=Demetria terragena TaxID=63959 RepID=UPI0003619896|nr:DUF4233 domain-containing protein [Demetria terragena]